MPADALTAMATVPIPSDIIVGYCTVFEQDGESQTMQAFVEWIREQGF